MRSGRKRRWRNTARRSPATSPTRPTCPARCSWPSTPPAGFAEVSIRSAAEGCYSGWIGYLEGWYVEPQSRFHGTGRALVCAAEVWAQSQGCREFASDTRFLDSASAQAHAALGFTEVEQLRCFRKAL